MIYKLLKILHDLKQLPQIWYERLLIFFLQKLGLLQINIDYSIFMAKIGLNCLVIYMFIDDIKIIASKEKRII